MADLLEARDAMTAERFDPETVRQLALILTETGLTEIEVEAKDSRIRVVRAHPPAAQAPVHAAVHHMAPPPVHRRRPAAGR